MSYEIRKIGLNQASSCSPTHSKRNQKGFAPDVFLPLSPLPLSGVTISASIRANSTVLSPDLQRLLPACDPARFGTAHSTLAGICSAALDGDTATSDVEGIVVFDKLKFSTALPGNTYASLAPTSILFVTLKHIPI